MYSGPTELNGKNPSKFNCARLIIALRHVKAILSFHFVMPKIFIFSGFNLPTTVYGFKSLPQIAHYLVTDISATIVWDGETIWMLSGSADSVAEESLYSNTNSLASILPGWIQVKVT